MSRNIVEEAKKRYDQGTTYMSDNYAQGKDDLLMLVGIGHWPDKVVTERKNDDRPCLVINKLPSYTDKIKNDARLNKMGIVVSAAGMGATKQVAQTMQGIIRGIESNSDSSIVYQTALDGAVDNGFGYFRILTEWSESSPWEQEIKLARIRNPFSVIIDPAHVEADARDARWIIISEMVLRDEYEEEYGVEITPFSMDSDPAWFEEDRVRVAEYWVKEPITKLLYLLSDGRTVDGEEWDSISDDLKAKEITIHLEPNPNDPNGPPVEVEGPAPEGSGYPQGVLNPTPTVERKRKIKTHKVVQYIVDGEKVLDKKEWKGKYIPIVPVWGKEIVIENERYLRGAIRFAKDPQRMYNYFRTAATETVALAPKAPYIMEEGQIEGHEDEWESANRKNIAVLTYKSIPGVPPPQRQIVSQTAIGEITEANISDGEMKATTSIYNASLGAPGNEVSGRAINARKIEGDVANFTYHDNLKRAIKYAGDILLDLIPKTIDTTTQVLIINDKDEEELVFVNQEVMDVASGKIVRINDLTLGRYKCTISTGPSFNTQREEAVASMIDFVRVAPETAKIFIDLIAESQDWPLSKKIAARLKKLLLPPDIDDDGPTPPQQPAIEDIIKQLKAQSIELGNYKKKLDIVEKRWKLDDTYKTVAEAGAAGALQTMGIGEEQKEGDK